MPCEISSDIKDIRRYCLMLPLDRVSALKADNKRLNIFKQSCIISTTGSLSTSLHVLVHQEKPLLVSFKLFCLCSCDSNQVKYRSNQDTAAHVEHLTEISGVGVSDGGTTLIFSPYLSMIDCQVNFQCSSHPFIEYLHCIESWVPQIPRGSLEGF